MHVRYKDKMPKKETEVALGNLYDMNKQMMAQAPEISKAELQLAKEHLRAWFTANFTQKYFMLLCAERKDFTLFNLSKDNNWNIANPMTIWNATNDIIECMTNRGQLLSIEDQQDNAWELWIKTEDDECYAYYLFPYGEAVLEY